MVVQATGRGIFGVEHSVVKGHRNGGSSNSAGMSGPSVVRCERPPKWWFKQLVSCVLKGFSSSCERPPKWWFKQLEH